MSVRLRSGLQVICVSCQRNRSVRRLQYFTGSKEHNVTLRGMAKDLGLKINEYGVYRVADGPDATAICGATESDVYEQLGLPWISPETA